MNSTQLIESNTDFSKCKLYRWYLSRKVNKIRRTLLFVGLNPSKANSNYDDATSRRILDFCISWGYGNLLIVNLFARISSDPSLLKKVSNPIGSSNNHQLFYRALQWSKDPSWDLWLGWGNNGIWKDRNSEVIQILKPHTINRFIEFPNASGPLAVASTKRGQPVHPLYLPKNSALKPFRI